MNDEKYLYFQFCYKQLVFVDSLILIITSPSTEVDECAQLGCDHSCILHNGVPTCLCSAGYILGPDEKSCQGTWDDSLTSPTSYMLHVYSVLIMH